MVTIRTSVASDPRGSNNLAAENRKRWYRADEPMCMGCLACVDQSVCGGLRISEAAVDCRDLCQSCDPTKCQLVCIKNLSAFTARVREVQGFTYDTLPSIRGVPHPKLPGFVPLVYHGASRTDPFSFPAVAVPLRELFRRGTGRIISATQTNLCQRFKITFDTSLVITGVDRDPVLEAYWGKGRGAGLVEQLASIKPALVTSPNFSLFSDTSRWDNLYNMKRIAIAWHELASAHIPTALHVNARSDYDWVRWAEFLRSHREITCVAFEFATGAAYGNRAAWYVSKLIELSQRAERDLMLVVRGGLPYLPLLRRAYGSVIFISAVPFIKTMQRYKLLPQTGGKLGWERVLRLRGQFLDDLLAHNACVFSEAVQPLRRTRRPALVPVHL